MLNTAKSIISYRVAKNDIDKSGKISHSSQHNQIWPNLFTVYIPVHITYDCGFYFPFLVTAKQKFTTHFCQQWHIKVMPILAFSKVAKFCYTQEWQIITTFLATLQGYASFGNLNFHQFWQILKSTSSICQLWQILYSPIVANLSPVVRLPKMAPLRLFQIWQLHQMWQSLSSLRK